MPGQNKTYCQDESGNYGKTIWQYRWPSLDLTNQLAGWLAGLTRPSNWMSTFKIFDFSSERRGIDGGREQKERLFCRGNDFQESFENPSHNFESLYRLGKLEGSLFLLSVYVTIMPKLDRSSVVSCERKWKRRRDQMTYPCSGWSRKKECIFVCR